MERVIPEFVRIIIELKGGLIRKVYVPKEVTNRIDFQVDILDRRYSAWSDIRREQKAIDAPLEEMLASGQFVGIR